MITVSITTERLSDKSVVWYVLVQDDADTTLRIAAIDERAAFEMARGILHAIGDHSPENVDDKCFG